MKITHLINDKEIGIYNNVDNLNKENNKNLNFFLDNIENNIYITDRFVFERENDEYKIHIEIGSDNLCTIYLKEKDLTFDVNVIDAKYKENNNIIEYEYILETDNDKHKIIIEK